MPRHFGHGLEITFGRDRKPASMMSTPSFSSWAATFSFSSRFIEQPGDCSPSRSVVSKINTVLDE
jgi:hypothetical protein